VNADVIVGRLHIDRVIDTQQLSNPDQKTGAMSN
jgi:hypothetical protein